MDTLRNPDKYYENTYNTKEHGSNVRKRSFISDYDYINPDKYVNCGSAVIENDESTAKESNYYLALKQTTFYESYCASLRCKLSGLDLEQKALVRLRFRIWSNNLAVVSTFRLGNVDLWH
jgi:hypothetical protein